eukprot:5311308-Prymnesium_polylepis.1
MANAQGRTNSTDPKASLDEKKKEIKKAKEVKAEAVAAEAEKKEAKKAETAKRAREMQDNAQEAWRQRALNAHA